MMQLHEVCLTVMTGQPGSSVGKAVGHLHCPHRLQSGIFWIQGVMLHQVILARFASSTSLSQQESRSICNSSSSVISMLWSAPEES